MSPKAIGILFGLGMALSQSLSYIFSRLYVVRRQGGAVSLLVGAHLWMALFSLVALPFVWTPEMPPLRDYAWLLAGVDLPYLAGQLGLFVMMRHAQASRVAPLLALKVVFLAVLTTVFLQRVLTEWQWVSVVLCVAGAFFLTVAGKRLPYRVLPWLFCTLLGYSLSDINIEQLVYALAPVSKLRASMVGTCLAYIACGVVVLPLLPWAGGKRVLKDWSYSLPFALFWYLAMVCLFVCFAHIGPVFGNILQSIRGILSILIGALLAKRGFSELEERLPGRVLLWRLLAAGLMIGAVCLFALDA